MKLITIGKSKRLIENRFYKDENLTSENIAKAFNLAGWQETRDWIGRDDDLTFIKGPSRISFNIVTNSGYNFTYYKDFEPKEYSADYIIYSGRNLKELEMDIEDFNNLEAKDFLKYKAPEFPWTKTTQETKTLESKKLYDNIAADRWVDKPTLTEAKFPRRYPNSWDVDMSDIKNIIQNFFEYDEPKITVSFTNTDLNRFIATIYDADFNKKLKLDVDLDQHNGYSEVMISTDAVKDWYWSSLSEYELIKDLEDLFMQVRDKFPEVKV